MKTQLKEILEEVRAGSMSVDDALLKIKEQPFADIGYAKVDTYRKIRQGTPEVIYGEGKTPEQIIGIARTMLQDGQQPILITRLQEASAALVGKEFSNLDYHPASRIGIIGNLPEKDGIGKILVATAGTSDIPAAEEAALTAEAYGNEVVCRYDMGVSGLHRLLAHMDDIMSASVIIAVAGMEGALASVIGGLADCPVIAVPTSVGYGASFGGVTALLAMLNSCASGVAVVNIDNGFGAGYLASRINHMEIKK